MKKFKQLFEGKTLDIQEDSISYATGKDLKTYLTVADKFISNEAKTIINYLINHNDSFVKTFCGNQKGKNPIVAFYEKSIPSDPELREVYNAIKKLDKDNRLIEIPLCQTDEQFKGIINKTINPDEIFLDLTSEKGRNEVAIKYKDLVSKIVNQYRNKSGLDEKQLISAAWEGFVNAMNTFAKNTQHKGDNEMDKRYRATTFTQYAAYVIRNFIIGDIRNVSRTVRVPISAQNREKETRGAITKTNTMSGDKKLSDDENAKTVFDLTAAKTLSTHDVDQKDIDKLLQDVYVELEKHFDKKTMYIWYSYLGLNGYEKLQNKEIAKKYNVVPSNISYYCGKINQYIQSHPKLMEIMSEVYELMYECLAEWDDENDDEPRKIDINEVNKNNNEDDE